MWTLYKKELNYYLNNPVGYIVLILFGVFANLLFVKDVFVTGSASMKPFFNILPWIFLVFIPALTMRIFAEEKRTNTIEILLTLPISETGIVISKFFALVTVTAIGLILTLGLPVTLSFLTKVYYPEIFVGYIGSLFLASAFIAVSMFFSHLTKNQIVAFLASILTLFLLFVLSSDFVAPLMPRFIINSVENFLPLTHFNPFIKGVVDLRSLFFFASFITLFLFLTIIDLEKRK